MLPQELLLNFGTFGNLADNREQAAARLQANRRSLDPTFGKPGRLGIEKSIDVSQSYSLPARLSTRSAEHSTTERPR